MASKDKVIIFGGGQNAAMVLDILSADSHYQPVAFTVDREYVGEGSWQGLPVVSFEEVEAIYPPDQHGMLVAISYRRVNRLRAEKVAQARAKGYSLISHVSSQASLPGQYRHGDNCLIGASIIGPFVQIGDDVVIAAGCVVGHHTIIGDHCYLGPGAIVSGSVTLEPYCVIGAGAVVRDRLTLREATVVGAGAVILEDTAAQGVYLAQPAERLSITSDQLPVG